MNVRPKGVVQEEKGQKKRKKKNITCILEIGEKKNV